MLQEFTEAVEETAEAVMNEIHTAMPGEILSFDAANCVASVKPAGKFVTSDGMQLDYPVVTEVPVVFPFCQQSGTGMVFPVKKGDSCIIIVSEVELDAWRSGAESEGPLRFDLTNAMAVPGLLRGGNMLAAEAAKRNAVMLGAPGVEVSVSGSGVMVDVKGMQAMVSESGIAVGGDLKVNGNIIYTGTCNRA